MTRIDKLPTWLALAMSCGALAAQATDLPYRNPGLPVEQRVADLLGRMTLDEKLGQMVMGGRDWVTPAQVTELQLGSMLSGGDSPPPDPNTPDGWIAMVQGYQAAALGTRLGIPLLYGIDAVHGFGALPGATVFPHQVALAAAGDEDLMRRIGAATARELAAVGLYWNFAPLVAVVDDIRWGRAYESLGENTDLVTRLARAYTTGYQSGLADLGPGLPRPLLTAKHFLGDGGVAYGSSHFQLKGVWSRLDRGDTRGEETALLARFLPPFQAQIEAGVGAVMVSYSRWNGILMHGHGELLQGLLRQQLGFRGLVISDWEAIALLPAPGFDQQVAMAVNAGVDILMEPASSAEVIGILRALAASNQISAHRIDEAVAHVLRVKFAMGLFEHPGPVAAAGELIGSPQHRALAREAVRKSQVLLKNQEALPLRRGQHIRVAGAHADDLGLQNGGWTLAWSGFQGDNARLPGGTSILAGLRQVGGTTTRIDYSASGDFVGPPADVALVLVGEPPYAEWLGDRDAQGLRLSPQDQALIARMRPLARKLVLVLVSGRPLILDQALETSDALVAAWLPGSEGAGVADTLFGDAPFTGKLPYAWPRDADSLLPASASPAERRPSLLYEFGYGLSLTKP
jgi:beta-glucosidase